jgi:NhaP-type Na+/H+ or K+/H+ antiporter
MTLITSFSLLVFVYSLISRKLERTVITAPILFSIAGVILFFFNPIKIDLGNDLKSLLLLAEIGLVLTLFTDASHINRSILRSNRLLPLRLLSIGLLFSIVLGALAAMVIFNELTIWEAGILAAILAPTDAGLGQIIVNSPKVPERIRQALNVEAGLNDGLSVPFLMCFIALSLRGSEGAGAVLFRFIYEQLGYGTLVGTGIGLLGGLFLGFAKRKNWMSHSLQQLGLVSLPVLCFLASEVVSASMFIAAFIAGLAVQVWFKDAGKHSGEFTEGWGQLLNFLVFFLFGLLFARSWNDFTPEMLLYAILSLTLVRMIPVALALIGTRLSTYTIIFMGWFGPRGLASIVLGLVFLEHATNTPGSYTVRLVVMITVMLSILAHGLTTLPGINLYVKKIRLLPGDAEENRADAKVSA